MIADIDKDVSVSKLISFVDDTRLYSGVGSVTDCDNLLFDLDTVIMFRARELPYLVLIDHEIHENDSCEQLLNRFMRMGFVVWVLNGIIAFTQVCRKMQLTVCLECKLMLLFYVGIVHIILYNYIC